MQPICKLLLRRFERLKPKFAQSPFVSAISQKCDPSESTYVCVA